MTLNTNDAYSWMVQLFGIVHAINKSQVFPIGSSVVNNANYVGYCFHSVKGFSKNR